MTATDPAGPWSDPVVVQGAPGIDPDLFFDEDGRLWYTGQQKPKDPEFIDQKEIWMQELNLETFQLMGERFICGVAHVMAYGQKGHIFIKMRVDIT